MINTMNNQAHTADANRPKHLTLRAEIRNPKGQPNPAPPSGAVNGDTRRCSPFHAIALLTAGLGLTIIGSLSIMALKYSQLSALSMTPEAGLGMVIPGTIATIGAVWCLIKGEMSQETEEEFSAYQGRGFRLGSGSERRWWNACTER